MDFFWPQTNVTNPSFLGRLGRVFHWFWTGMAVLAFVIGAGVTIAAHFEHQASKRAIADWDRRHAPRYDVDGVPPAIVMPAGYADDARPFEHPDQPGNILIGAIIGAIFFLFGRGGRYVLSGE